MEFRNIVVDIHDPGQDEQPTIEAAVAIAKGTETRVRLFHNLYHRSFLNERGGQDEVLNEARELLMQNRQGELDELVAELEARGISASSHLLWSEEGWLELTRYAGQQQADLVISISQPHTRWQRLTLSNEDWQLIRYSTISLLLVKPESSKSYSHAVAAVDPLHADDKPASLDHRILDAASSFCRIHQADLEVINVVTPVLSAAPTVAEPLLATDTMAQEAATDAHRRRVRELLESHQLEDAQINVMVGEPADQIVSFVAERQCDLLIMGAVARSALGRLLIGNTAEKVLDAVDCDLLIVKPEGLESDVQAA